MGCSSSKEVTSSTVPQATNTAPTRAPKPAMESAVSAPSNTRPAPSSSFPPGTQSSVGASGKASIAADSLATNAEVASPLLEAAELGHLMVQLNDVVPGSTKGGTHRGRFESYASGASTPNTSSGNISWTGSDTDEQLQLDTSTSRRSPKRNPRMLKHSHSGSAIDLENLHNNAACTLTSKVVHIEVPFGKPIEEVYEGVHNGPVLGSGVSGLVRLVTHKKTGIEYAVKCLDLGLVGTKEGLQQLREEIFIMCQLDHPNIVRLEEVYESHSEIYLVQELCLGGELFDRLDEQPDYHYTEAECARLVKQMLSAVRYLHSKGIIHRDLKLENFLFSSKAADSELKMIDFGLSKHFRFGEVHHEAVGTPYTVAPEVIKGSYDERCDIWAIGVITFLLFSGDPPFGGCGGPEPLMQVRSNILNGTFEFQPEDVWSLVSNTGKNFVRALLVTDPKKRPTAREAQKHAWLKHWASRDSSGNGQDNVLNPNVVKALVNFKEFSDMRKLLSEVLSFTLLPDQIKDLRKEFEIMDTDGSGEISLEALKEVLVSNAGAGSLGALTEEEVEDIFNAMRVNKAETRIHWHEFIAAGLSQCQVDDRNLRLAFDRLDSDHKGYITLDDIVNLVGNDELHNEKEMRNMWRESMKNLNSTQTHITYNDFLLLMKGQAHESHEKQNCLLQLSQVPLSPLLEGVQMADDTKLDSTGDRSTVGTPPTGESHLGSRVDIIGAEVEDASHFLMKSSLDESSMHSLPNLGAAPMYDGSSNSLVVTPSNSGTSTKNISTVAFSDETKIPDLQSYATKAIPQPSVVSRRRSKSLEGDPDMATEDTSSTEFTSKDSRRALNLPEHAAKQNMKDEWANKSALAVNRQLYRAHRQMRLSVLDACKRFEEQQASRARDTLMKEKVKEAMGAGLVMRHGTKFQVTSDAIRTYLDEAQAEQQALVDKANRRGGRGRSARKKTISDMSAMMTPSMGQDEVGLLAAKAHSKTPNSPREVFNNSFSAAQAIPDLSQEPIARLSFGIPPEDGGDHQNEPATKALAKESQHVPPNLPQVDQGDIRKATVPGQFHKTLDPFSSAGMYGGSRLRDEAVIQIQSPAPISYLKSPNSPPGSPKRNAVAQRMNENPT
ncbi:protein kinase domain containing protein [Nitzschia inconspicua]|uniref:Protein kinase domain containing protein n=1 Tax=Nitzschia inconspicua TaxID=303405 RepID=A0A9K3K7Q4_9STRA|nr:protein kinase domain containing protein [Nitzschia inconspicua]KAG7340483.1 protein kinase domain containing protein [Nitzschia inconspicua]